ncbi:GNAT family N-acetyltransferase [Pseudomonas rustica]
MAVSIRPVTISDRAVVSSLLGALLSELRGLEPPGHRLVGEALLERVLERSFGFLLLEEESAIGTIMISEGCAIYAGGSFGVITELYVIPDKRSSGAAHLLISEGEQLGRERGWSMLEVGAPAMPKWVRSWDFYLKKGFIEIGPRLRKRLGSS